jgi:hypothetical protein
MIIRLPARISVCSTMSQPWQPLWSSCEERPCQDSRRETLAPPQALSLLGISNSRVEHDRKRVLAGQASSPLLLVRAPHNQQVITADGYHRMCAVYSFNEDGLIPCKIV